MHSLVSIGSRHWKLSVEETLVLNGDDLVCGDNVEIWSESCHIRILNDDVWYERRGFRGLFRFQTTAETTAVQVSHDVHQPLTLQFYCSLALGLQGYPVDLPSRLRVDEHVLLECREKLRDECR